MVLTSVEMDKEDQDRRLQNTESPNSPNLLNSPCVAVFITKYLVESCGANNYLETSIFEIQNFGVCVPQNLVEFCELTQSKKVVII